MGHTSGRILVLLNLQIDNGDKHNYPITYFFGQYFGNIFKTNIDERLFGEFPQ